MVDIFSDNFSASDCHRFFNFMKKLALKKINLGLALTLIIVFSTISALILTSVGPNIELVQAYSGVGLQINSSPKKCVYDSCEGCATCFSSCPVCGDLAGVCASLYEVRSSYLSGTNLLHKKAALCLSPSQIIPPKGGRFRMGSRCLGLYTGTGPHALFNFGCYR